MHIGYGFLCSNNRWAGGTTESVKNFNFVLLLHRQAPKENCMMICGRWKFTSNKRNRKVYDRCQKKHYNIIYHTLLTNTNKYGTPEIKNGARRARACVYSVKYSTPPNCPWKLQKWTQRRYQKYDTTKRRRGRMVWPDPLSFQACINSYYAVLQLKKTVWWSAGGGRHEP